MGTSLAAQRRLLTLPLPVSPSLSSPLFSYSPASPHCVGRVRLVLAALVAVLALPLAAATAAAATAAATPPATATPAALVPGDTCKRYVPSRWLLSSPPWAPPTCPWRTGGRPAVPLAAAVDEATAADAAAAAAVVSSRRTADTNGSHVGGGGRGGSNAPPPLRPVVIILTHTAVANLRRTLMALARTPAADRAPYTFVVSVDVGGGIAPVRRLDGSGSGGTGNGAGYTHAVLLEDDLEVAPDFFAYFSATLPLLDGDASLFCVSAWNDNGYPPWAADESARTRTDFFPGLGWGVARRAWAGPLRASWGTLAAPDGRAAAAAPPPSARRPWALTPAAVAAAAAATTGWDHWLRLPRQWAGRECVVPAAPRVVHFGGAGSANVGAPQARLLSRMGVATRRPVAYSDAARLTRAAADADGAAAVAAATRVSAAVAVAAVAAEVGAGSPRPPPRTLLVLYRREAFARAVARPLGIFPSPRGGRRGVIRLTTGRLTLLLADVRGCPYLRPPERVAPRADAWATVAARGEACAAACAVTGAPAGRPAPATAAGAGGGRCDASAAAWLNDCTVLAALTGCGGCGVETGADLPAAVVGDDGHALATAGLCLVVPEGGGGGCGGHFAHTRRACACVPRGA
ncbi:hypothetical protein BU14_0031s0086 [Porphyra umbilicalis]|uniref:alpha-1,3-mannosyl-glycoprotein 2-beta-N-acetylglucosaminyltransferase n=1 Tax=Porphyra umbilicalis TaxID=2786 RepID=A0A1X6PJN5_PORUM|nr:hypothetical protein BU14_0031s0086 [Porphyra umbilicalis]|eukprot:OSX80918.1 hypothetical protein BU14_0031s0086 [Porphyra umbilicalis]